MKSNVRTGLIKQASELTQKTTVGFLLLALHNSEGFGTERMKRVIAEFQRICLDYHERFQQVEVRNGEGRTINTQETLFLALDRDLKELGIEIEFTYKGEKS